MILDVSKSSTATQPRLLRPPLKWAGGKRWQVPFLREYWTTHAGCRLVEPFCGGLAVAIALKPRRAVLNDINPHVINFYSWLKRGLTIEEPMANSSRAYYEGRASEGPSGSARVPEPVGVAGTRSDIVGRLLRERVEVGDQLPDLLFGQLQVGHPATQAVGVRVGLGVGRHGLHLGRVT